MTLNKTILTSACIFVVGILVVVLLFRRPFIALSKYAPVDVRFDSTEFKYTNPLLFSKTSKDMYATEFQSFNDYINSYIQNVENNAQASDVSVYFRDLNTSHWTGVNEDATYEPSSMLKIVMLVAYYKAAQDNPSLLDKELYIGGTDSSGQYYAPKHLLAPGYHTVNELINQMVVESDNSALAALYSYDPKIFDEVYKDFRLPALPTENNLNDFMSAKSFSVVFRSLYNATYLSWNSSEKALALLTKTVFNNGIVEGLPAGVAVAHKFGEHIYSDSMGVVSSRELHDCGIVYYPNDPYLLCVMTKGQNFADLENVISGISKYVYGYVQASNQSNQ